MNETKVQKTSDYGKRSVWQWVIIYLIVGGIIYAGIYYIFFAKKGGYNYSQQGQYKTQPTVKQQANPTTEASSSDPQSQTTITYSASGFSPPQVTVQNGGKVTWINASNVPVQIGVNPHPTHTGNREITGGEFTVNLQPKEQKTIVVSKTGSFGYHNHLNPSEGGIIEVK